MSDIESVASAPPIQAQVSASGARVEFELSVSPVGHQAHMMDNRTLPPRVRGSGLVDTGTTMSLISDKIADALALETIHSVEVHTAVSSSMAPCYTTEFRFIDRANVRMVPVPLVVARAPNLREDMVIGLDVLRRCRLEWDGPAGTLRLSPANGLAVDA